MIVSVSDKNGAPIWERRSYIGEPLGGLASQSYLRDGTQNKIIDALREALEQAEAQLSGASLQVRDIVSDIGAAAAKVYDDVPVVPMRDRDPRREHSIEATIIVMRPTLTIGTKVGVVHD
jgi:hypothetical protein